MMLKISFYMLTLKLPQIVIFLTTVSLVLVVSCSNSSADPLFHRHSEFARLSQVKEIAELDPNRNFKGQQVAFLGFVDNQTIILTRWRSGSNDSGHILRWNIVNRKTVNEIPLSMWLDSDLCLSSNGKTLTTTNVRMNRAFKEVKAYRTTTLSSSSLKILIAKKVPTNEDVVGFLSSDNNGNQVIIKSLKEVPISKNESTYAADQFQWIDTISGAVEKKLYYHPARECDKLITSPNRNYLLGLFYAEPFDSHGESDYGPYVDQLERQGFIDIISPKTGKILWHIEPSKQRPIGDPLFFISPTRFISSDTVFNIQTKTARHWNAITPTRKCLAAVPEHPNCALFLTPKGLQLRNWQKDKLLVNWPSIKKPGRIMFSPDLKMFSFKRGSLIQFWKFDPKWLK